MSNHGKTDGATINAEGVIDVNNEADTLDDKVQRSNLVSHAVNPSQLLSTIPIQLASYQEGFKTKEMKETFTESSPQMKGKKEAVNNKNKPKQSPERDKE